MGDQCIQSGSLKPTVTLSEVIATNACGESITCTDSVDGTVYLPGDTLTSGSYTVNCTVTRNNCQGTGNFSFIVSGEVPTSAVK